MPTREQLKADHPEWTDEQIEAELARLQAENPPPVDPPAKKDEDPNARLRRQKDEAEKRAAEAERKLAERERADAEAQGQWEQLAKQYEQERDEARTELANLKAKIKVESSARALKFKNADEAVALLRERGIDQTDDTAVTDALTALAEERPHLIDTGRPGPSGLPSGGDPQTGGLTLEEVKAMTPAEVNARWDEVQKVLNTQQAA